LKALITLTQTIGNSLKLSWKYVLECLSQIDFLQLMASGKKEWEFFDKNSSPKIENIRIEQKDNKNLLESIDNSSIDRIFLNSVQLPWESLLEMIDFLCEISKNELKDPKKPRIFCLQKLVEVADFNMDRIKIIWSKMWNKIKEYFSQIGAHPNIKISMFVIDSLKQLSIKFLQVD